MIDTGGLYEFAFRGLLTEEALDRAGRLHRNLSGIDDTTVGERVGLDSLDDAFVAAAKRMAIVYAAVAAFENSVRKLISDILLEAVGEGWWESSVSQSIRKRAESRREEEEKIKWHGQRGDALINYTELGDLANIIRNSWQYFEPHIPSIEWATSIIAVIERSRNVIMHSGGLSMEDVERVGINIRDWSKQVGT
jgi:HEPN superfamily Swt1-like protein